MKINLSQQIKTGKTKVHHGKGRPYSIIWDILCVVILNISGDRASFLLFFVSESLELEISTAQTISTH